MFKLRTHRGVGVGFLVGSTEGCKVALQSSVAYELLSFKGCLGLRLSARVNAGR